MKLYLGKWSSILLLIAIVLIIFTCVFIVFRLGVNDESGWSNVSNSISFIALLTSSLTVFFVYKTYMSQNRNVEFNRALDILYKQLEFTNQKHINRGKHEAGLIRLGEKLSVDLSDYKDEVEVNFLIKNILGTYRFLETINNDLVLFEDIMCKSSFSASEFNTLFKIVERNYFNYVGNLTSVVKKADSYFNSEANKEVIATKVKNFSAGTESYLKKVDSSYDKIFSLMTSINSFLQKGTINV